ncbi:MAG TPA: plasmid partitioning protein RepB C-terminal domain-containing protein, partial [bacterium]|nr:plasmid partitioning protein RepB C-terminal domain-containing protein [bacterium]
KRPITVSRRIENKGDNGYDLVCGQGRLEAYISLGETEVPAIVISVSREQRLIMSLVENVARRNPTTLDHVKQIGILRERGYTIAQIGKKIGMSKSQVGGLVTLLDHGEARLLQEVEWENIPIGIAVIIATAADDDVQRALTEAFEKKQLLAKDVSRARKIVEKRKLYGKSYGVPNLYKKKMQTSESVMRAYNREAQRQKLLVKKAKLCETRLLFISSALRMLFGNESFV